MNNEPRQGDGPDLPIPIELDLEAEALVKDHVSYYKMAGSSKEMNYRSPDAFVFIFFDNCDGWHEIDFVRYEERDCQVHISFPGQIHSWDSGPRMQGHKLIISKYFAEKYLFEYGFITRSNQCPVLNLKAADYLKLSEEVRRLGEVLGEEGANADFVMLRTRLIVSMINHLITRKSEEDSIAAGKVNHYILMNFVSLLDQFFHSESTVAFYADKLAITPNYLNIVCKRHSGLNAKSMINERRLLEAKRLLLGTTLSIKEISFKLGFSEISGFSYYVKNNTGFNPRQFREKCA